MMKLVDAKNLTQDKLTDIVIDEFRKDSLLDIMEFDDNASLSGAQSLNYVYNRLSTLPTASFRKIGNEYTAQEALTTQHTATLKVLGGSFEVDRIIQNHVKGAKDQITFQLEQKIKATKALFSDTFINGDTGVKEESFDGLEKAIKGTSTEIAAPAAIDLSTSENITKNGNAFMDYLDKLLSEIDGTPGMILVNTTLKAIINGIARRSGYFSTTDVDAFGKPVTKYSGISIIELGDKPGTSKPIINISSEGKTSLFVARVGLDGVHAIAPEKAENLIKPYLPDMTKPGAVKKGEVEMLTAVALKSTRAAGMLTGIKVK